MTDQRNICYCGEYGGGVHTRSARCPGGESAITSNERFEFESWAAQNGFPTHRHPPEPDTYSAPSTHCAWAVWQYLTRKYVHETKAPVRVYAANVVGDAFMLVDPTRLADAEKRNLELWVPYEDVKPLLSANGGAQETEPELPESLRDPVKNLERGRELLAAMPCWCPYCNQPHGVNQTPATDAALAQKASSDPLSDVRWVCPRCQTVNSNDHEVCPICRPSQNGKGDPT